MKHKHFPQDPNPKTAGATRLATAGLNADEVNFVPSPDEVARRAYFTYENEGSLPGHDVQHWLQAETQLIAERKLTMTHGYHNPT
jgi:Fe-S cluster biosynthesis and repair protein YggX